MDTTLAEDDRLAKLLLEKLEEPNVTLAAFNGILSTEVIRPLHAELKKELEEELVKLQKDASAELCIEPAVAADANADPVADSDANAEVPVEVAPGATVSNANNELLRQLLEAYKLQVISATGESALMKRLSPIMKNCVRAASARAAPGRAVDEEQSLVRPEDSVTCLVQQLWPALLASLKAQVSDIILSSALRPIEKAGKSVRRMAGRLDDLEGALIAESKQLATKFGLVDMAGKEGKGGLRSRLLKTTLTAATQYEVSVGGFSGSLDMARLAWTCSRAKLTKHENELEYLKKKLEKLEELTTTDQTWRDVTETWQATLALLKSVEVERGVAVLQCIASDEKLLQALGVAETLYKIKGDAPTDLVMQLNDDVGAHIRSNAYKYDKLISLELVRIRQVKEMQWKVLTLIGSAFVATMIGTANLLSRLYYDVLRSEENESDRWLLALLFPVGAGLGLLLLLLCCAGCYYRRDVGKGALEATLKTLGGKAAFQQVFASTIDKSDAGLEKAFKQVDTDANGQISVAEMRVHIASVYGSGLDESITAKMLKAADTDGDGEVSLDEFKRIMRAGPEVKLKALARAGSRTAVRTAAVRDVRSNTRKTAVASKRMQPEEGAKVASSHSSSA